MRVVIFGGRDFNNEKMAFSALDHLHSLHNFSCVIDGMARGADTLGFKWAQHNGIETERYPAQWKTYGRAAGPIRNQQMIDDGKPDMGIAFPGGTGTADMKKRLKSAGINVLSIS